MTVNAQMTSIHVVALGVYGEYARHHTQKLFETLPYVLCATLDLQPPREYGYSALNLRVVLQSLVPKPQAFIIGLQIDDAMAKEAQGVWNEYMQSSGQSNTIAWKVCFEILGRNVI